MVYTRDSDGQVKTSAQKGLPGEEKLSYEYDLNSRLSKAGTIAYGYDSANNPTKIGSNSYTYDSASEIETGAGTKFAYDSLGERSKATPSKGPATSYAYDQAGNLTAVTRPEESKVPPIKDTYGYDGSGLRSSQTIGASTTYMTGNVSGAGLPTILNDGQNSYIYGPGGLPVEQIDTKGTVLYLHHDQQGSTRLLTNSTGAVAGTSTYDAYGNLTGSTGASTTPLGYDGQYTSSDTGLIYLRARTYDPTTAQFLNADPLEMYTRGLYKYAGDNPANYGDASGLVKESVGERFSCPSPLCFPLPSHQEAQHAEEALETIGHEIGHVASEVEHGVSSVWNAVVGTGESSSDSTQGERGSECGEVGFNGNQDALIKIANEAKRSGLSPEDAEVLREWAEEYELPFRGPEAHPGRGFGSLPHIHVGPVNHIPVG